MQLLLLSDMVRGLKGRVLSPICYFISIRQEYISPPGGVMYLRNTAQTGLGIFLNVNSVALSPVMGWHKSSFCYTLSDLLNISWIYKKNFKGLNFCIWKSCNVIPLRNTEQTTCLIENHEVFLFKPIVRHYFTENTYTLELLFILEENALSFAQLESWNWKFCSSLCFQHPHILLVFNF